MDWVSRNLVRWEKSNFPKGARCHGTEEAEMWRELWDKQQYFCIVAWTLVNGRREMSGYLSWWLVDRGTSAWINTVFVPRKFQGRGIAEALLRTAVPIIQKKQLRVARIQVIEDNVPMLRIQERLFAEGLYQHKKKSDKTLNYWGDGRRLHYIEFRGS